MTAKKSCYEIISFFLIFLLFSESYLHHRGYSRNPWCRYGGACTRYYGWDGLVFKGCVVMLNAGVLQMYMEALLGIHSAQSPASV